MKYKTQEWYLDCQKQLLYIGLEASDKAKEYSEEYFKKLYQTRIKEYMDDYVKLAGEEQLSAEDFAVNRYLRKLAELNRLPDKIKDAIADIRVAALGFVTKDILEEITRFSKNIKKQVDTQTNEYWDYYQSIEDSIPRRIRQSLTRQHDAHIRKIGSLNGDYIIESVYGYEYKFTFKNALVHQNITKSGCLTWLYHEIYLHDGKYEVHILFDASRFGPLAKNRDIILTDVIICAEDIEVEIIEQVPEYYTEFL